MCKKMKAFHYLKNLELSSCINLYSNQYLFPEIDETQQWCTPTRALTLLGLNQAYLGQALSLIILSLTALASLL